MPACEFWNDAGATIHPVSMADYLPRPQLEAVQLHRLRVVVDRAYERVPMVRRRMDERGLRPGDIRSPADIARLPFTTKADLHDNYPFGLFASPLSDIVRLHATSGTTAKPVVVAYTRNDMEVWKNTIMRTLAAGGVGRGDILQNAYGYGLFTGGLGVHYGAEALGVTVIPISGGNTDRQLMVMQDFAVTAIASTPSYFLHILDAAGRKGIDIRSLPLRAGFFGAEPWSEAMRQRIEELAGIRAFDIYGLSEIIGPGVAAECRERCGLHVFEDHFYPEIVDPRTGEPLPEGAAGELVLTTLSKEAMPLLRYRTRDLSQMIAGPCPCGRTIRRLRRVADRADDMLIIRGVNVFPSQIEAALLTVDAALSHYQIVVRRERDLDTLEVQVEVEASCFSDEVKSLEVLRRRLGDAVERLAGVRAGVRLVEPNTIPRSEGKAARVRDLRKLP
jgi:phenylacetate-CoA ligase